MATLSTTPFAEGYKFLECPRWHDGRLYISDFFANRILSFDADGNEETVAEVEGMPGGLGFMPDGTLLAVSQFTHQVMKIVDGKAQPYADLSDISVGATNDMVVDANGNAYIGNWGFDLAAGGPPQPAKLALVRAGGAVEVAADGLIFPNGMVITPDGGTLLVAESFANRIAAFDIQSDATLTNHRTWAQLDQQWTPDGICFDAEGCVWAGNPLAGQFIRIREGGEIVDNIDCNGRWAVACVLGGDDRRTLYTLQADTNMEDQPKGISKGFIETVQVDVPGAGTP